MAYMVTIRRDCQVCGCRATFEVFNNLNASMGFFCTRDARRKHKQVAGDELRRDQVNK